MNDRLEEIMSRVVADAPMKISYIKKDDESGELVKVVYTIYEVKVYAVEELDEWRRENFKGEEK